MDKANFSQLLESAVNDQGVLSTCYTTFHGFSIGNQLLAWSQCLERNIPVGPIATYKRWSELGRQVKKGQKAIALVQPVIGNKKDATTGEKTGETYRLFVLKNNWFVLDQTDGPTYTPEQTVPQWDKAKALAALDISEVKFDHYDYNCQGYASSRTFAINPLAVFPHKTTFHEIAHIVLGHTSEGRCDDSESTPRDIREVEAECTAYILVNILGLAGVTESRGYVQHWLKGQQISDKSAQKILATANKILEAGQEKKEEK
jgi:antirestriction protein ArdC